MEPGPVKMAAEGTSSFDANPKRPGLQPQCEELHCRNGGRFSSCIFVTGGWTDSINFVKNMITEIFSIKTMSFSKNLDEGKTERGPETGEHSFWAVDCLP
jgi:hypothetical protein